MWLGRRSVPSAPRCDKWAHCSQQRHSGGVEAGSAEAPPHPLFQPHLPAPTSQPRTCCPTARRPSTTINNTTVVVAPTPMFSPFGFSPFGGFGFGFGMPVFMPGGFFSGLLGLMAVTLLVS